MTYNVLNGTLSLYTTTTILHTDCKPTAVPRLTHIQTGDGGCRQQQPIGRLMAEVMGS